MQVIYGGDDVFYAAIFDFALAGIGLCTLAFFAWCWFAFAEDRKQHPIYRDSATTETPFLQAKGEGSRCA